MGCVSVCTWVGALYICVCVCLQGMAQPRGTSRSWSAELLTQSSLSPGWGRVSSENFLALVLGPAAAADQTEDQLHTQPHMGAACPWRWYGDHSAPQACAPAGIGWDLGHCWHPRRCPMWGRSQSASRAVVHLWGRTALWPLAPHTLRSYKRRSSFRALCKPGPG